MLLDVKQKASPTQTYCPPSINLTVKSVQIGVGWLAQIYSGHSIGNATSGLIAKTVRRTAFAADRAPTCWCGPVTCERGRNASLKCVSPAPSHMNRVPTPWRSLSSCHGIQHPGSGKKPVSRVRRQLPVQNTGVTIAVDRIATRLRSLKLVIAESLHVFGAVHTMRGPLMERL